MSPLEAAGAAIDIHNASGAWNKALLDNSARPSGALVYSAKDGQLTREQFERLKAELEESFQGAAQCRAADAARRRARLEGDGASPKDMDFIEAQARRRARDRAGLRRAADAARHSRRQHLFQLRRGQPRVLAPDGAAAGQPHGEGAVGLARAGLRRLRARALELRPDLDAIEALRTEREALWARVRQADFLTDDEKRAAVGYGAIEGGDTLIPGPNDRHAGLDRASMPRRCAARHDPPDSRGKSCCKLRRDIARARGEIRALDLKRVEADGTFSGYASLFGEVDLGQDLVMPGAFRDSLARAAHRGCKMLFQHDPNEPIGVWLELDEDPRPVRAAAG